MAGGKKKKKPATNPARGFSTTSIASKPRSELPDFDSESKSHLKVTENEEDDRENPIEQPHSFTEPTDPEKSMTAEQFERHVDDHELQLIVEKHAQKSKRDAFRQKTRLETDRRVLRGQAEVLSTRKWLSNDLIEEILDLVKWEDRYSGNSTEPSRTSRDLKEEDLTVKLWTLQQALVDSGFLENDVALAINYVLAMSDRVASGHKDAIWGLEEALDWLARNSLRDNLPDYDGSQRKSLVTKHQKVASLDCTLASGSTSPRYDISAWFNGTSSSERPNLKKGESKPLPIGISLSTESDSDIDPDDLLKMFLDCKTKLFAAHSRSLRGKPHTKDQNEIAKLQKKIEKIESDVLFDKYVAHQRWEPYRIGLEKKAAEARKIDEPGSRQDDLQDSQILVGSENDTSQQAAKLGAALLESGESDSDNVLLDLFEGLPTNEVDPTTGKSSIIFNSSDGAKVIIRDFGKWMGVSPSRVLEETCRARDPGVKIAYSLISEASWSNRHALQISWSKSQSLLTSRPLSRIEHISTPRTQTFAMISVSTPDIKQSEAFIATVALFLVFNSSVRENKASLRLPAVWKELHVEFETVRKQEADEDDRAAIRSLREIVREQKNQELEDGVLITGAFRGRGGARTTENSDDSGSDKPNKPAIGIEGHQRIWNDKIKTTAYQMMQQSRMKLPMWSFKNDVLRAIDAEQCVIICGETGCGKSTQVPAFILEQQLSRGLHCKIYCTEPRRISAISLARRVSEELGEMKHDLGSPRSLVGYAIRLETKTSKETRLIYATTGIVLRMLEGSSDLKDITHIVIDEVHERSIDSDFLLIIVRKLMVKRPELKVVLMSATVDGDRFSKYLDGARVLNVPGRTFPVHVNYLEDAVELTGYTCDNGLREQFTDLDDEVEIADTTTSDDIKAQNTKVLRNYGVKTRNTIAMMDEYRIEYELVIQLIAKIASDPQLEPYSKALLVFLPGIAEIRQLNDMLLGHPKFSSNWFVYALHSTIASEDQEAAFLVPPPGNRKIVLATNIAETGITIPDVTCVIDLGKHREMRFDERRQLSRLLETFISRANAKQRRGRAGRVQEGLCFHLFTKYRHDELMIDQQTPEFLRLSLQDLAIRVKICKLGGIEETLGQALDPPSTKNIRRAIDALIDVRALTPAEDLTPLGIQLAKLPLDVFLGKLIILGTIFKCVDAVITIAAILSSKSPFSAPFGSRAQADSVRLGFRRGDSDLLTVYNAYLAWKRVCNGGASEYQFCRKNFLSPQTLSNIEDLKGQLVVSLVDSGFLPLTENEKSLLNRARFSNRRRQFFDIPQRANVNGDNDMITTSVICWSFYPKLLMRDGKGYRSLANNQTVSLHPTSVNKGHAELRYLSFYHIMQAKQFYNAYETTVAEDFSIALLCGDVRCDMYAGVLVLDGNRARFAVSDWKTMLVIKTLRHRLRDILTKSFKSPGKSLTTQQQRWMEVWQKMFSQEFKDA